MITKIRRIIRQSEIVRKTNNSQTSKAPLSLMLDLMRWTFTNRGYITNFFILGLDQKEKKLDDYLNFRSLKPYYNDFYPSNYLCLLEDKMVWEKFINNYPEYAPKNIGYATKNHFYLPDSKPQPIENILNYPMHCIVKNTFGFGGKDIFKIKIEDGEIYINGTKSSIAELRNKLPERAVIQELLEQHDDLKRLHPESLNTSRMITVNTGSEIHVIATFLRIGVGNSIVDNLAQGNIYIPIDMATGKLDKMGYSHKEPLFFLSHPQTGVVFDGYQIPFFKEGMEAVKKLHNQLPYFFVLGWDVAFTPSGPVIIETNNIHRVVHEQIAVGGLKQRFDCYIKEFMKNKKAVDAE